MVIFNNMLMFVDERLWYFEGKQFEKSTSGNIAE